MAIVVHGGSDLWLATFKLAAMSPNFTDRKTERGEEGEGKEGHREKQLDHDRAIKKVANSSWHCFKLFEM